MSSKVILTTAKPRNIGIKANRILHLQNRVSWVRFLLPLPEKVRRYVICGLFVTFDIPTNLSYFPVLRLFLHTFCRQSVVKIMGSRNNINVSLLLIPALILLTAYGIIPFDLFNLYVTLLSIIVTVINTVISIGGIDMITFIMVGMGSYGVISKRCRIIHSCRIRI